MPTILIVIYHVLVEIDTEEHEFITYLSEFQTACVPLLFSVAPAFVAESISSEANKLKLLLHDRLLDERGD